MRTTITQIDAGRLDSEWRALRQHVRTEKSQLVLLPEMAFAPWFCGAAVPDEDRWQAAVSEHERWLSRLDELGADIVAGAAPRNVDGKKYNMAYIWTRTEGLRWTHAKTYLPNDAGFWEANWYDRAPVHFRPLAVGGLRLGFMICTELWFMQHARDYGRQGIQLLLIPRSTPSGVNDKWLAGGRAAAVIAGGYCLSSNHVGSGESVELGGMGWICGPEGDVLATTDERQPFLTLSLDLALADKAKGTYPRYVDDSPI